MKVPDNGLTLDDVRAALNLTDFDYGPSHLRMAPETRNFFPERVAAPPREAGVLALIYPIDAALHVVLTRRTDHLRGHSGQISFPGGRRDAEDSSTIATALRETQEELGIDAQAITILGELSPLYIPPSHYNVYPCVGYIPTAPVFQPNPSEVAEVFTFALHDLLDERFQQHEYRDFQGVRVKIPYYQVSDHKVWGATAVMLSELQQRLNRILEQHKSEA